VARSLSVITNALTPVASHFFRTVNRCPGMRMIFPRRWPPWLSSNALAASASGMRSAIVKRSVPCSASFTTAASRSAAATTAIPAVVECSSVTAVTARDRSGTNCTVAATDAAPPKASIEAVIGPSALTRSTRPSP